MVKELNISKGKVVESPPVKENLNVEVEAVQTNEIGKEVNPTLETKKVKKKIQLSPKTVKLLLITSAVLLVFGIAAFYYFGIYKAKPFKNPSEIINLNSEYLISQAVASSLTNLPSVIPQEPRTEVSPINGLLFTKTEMNKLKGRRPVAVMINNHAEARPQSGLNSADIVYETLAESGITRYLGIFWSEAPAKVGPIRSARQYYLEWLSPYDPLFIYDGCADTDNPKTDACGNISSYNIKKIATIGAWRWNDGRRYAPHNEYSSITNAWEYGQKMNWDSFPTVKAWKFKNDAVVSERGTKTKINITFHQRINNNGLYDTVWTYDPKTNSYLLQTGKQASLDQETNTQVFAKNVVIQEVSMMPSYDDSGRIIQDTIGEGKAVFLIDGKILEGTWKKISRLDRTVYYYSDGNEVQFNRGRIWINALSRSEGKFAIIEQ
ncbi:hypothetical protein CVU76_01005 [Candidatus Dojkabacteria bacterium HGW-Dojkabacteria-1]|uniref:DUF3048 domain-containing protein n=1 Tax=Candidatus Dojkabacteria bacterium HGW-Dojkabacteria-1 TaxID=2013761 RepID=A0A2N2F335_9BACT|nr:MAG: hypothetical protein CVU76_01005 [Candidatus Dojkabacteria bacterium HGW-Dojkabacteria-1]